MDTIFKLSQENPVEVGRLTTDHAASSYGQPVLVRDGMAYGPADTLPFPEGMEFLASAAGEWVADKVACRLVADCTCGSEHRFVPFTLADSGTPTSEYRCSGCGTFEHAEHAGPGCFRVYCRPCRAALKWAKFGLPEASR